MTLNYPDLDLAAVLAATLDHGPAILLGLTLALVGLAAARALRKGA